MSQIKNQTLNMTEFHRRGRAIFDQVLPNLIHQHRNAFLFVEPNSGDYFVDMDEVEALTKARQKHPQATFAIFRLNETGRTGRV